MAYIVADIVAVAVAVDVAADIEVAIALLLLLLVQVPQYCFCASAFPSQMAECCCYCRHRFCCGLSVLSHCWLC